MLNTNKKSNVNLLLNRRQNCYEYFKLKKVCIKRIYLKHYLKKKLKNNGTKNKKNKLFTLAFFKYSSQLV